jgi:integrase
MSPTKPHQLTAFTALPIKSIDQDAKNKALATWEAGSKKHQDVGFYIEAILRHALTGKLRLRSGTDDVLLHEATSWRDVPAFYKRLADVSNDDARALCFTILTGARTDEVIGRKEKGDWVKQPATWAETEEIDGHPAWVIPKGRMKAKRDHRLPLSPEVMAILGKRRADAASLFEVSSANAMRDRSSTLSEVRGTLERLRPAQRMSSCGVSRSSRLFGLLARYA